MITRPYESLVILKAAGTDQDVARAVAQLEDPIKKLGGRLTSSQSMGRRRLAFRIARQTEGHYYLLKFQLATQHVGELGRLFRLNETIVRFVILSIDEEAAAAAAARKVEAEPQTASAATERGGS